MNIVDTTNNKRKLILSLVLLTSVVLLGTFAWYVWSSKDNTSMNVTIGDLADVSFKTGNDINITNLSPSFNYDDGALTEFSIRKKKGLTTDLYTNIYLDITSISDTLKSPSFKYELLSSSDGNTYNKVSSGNFQDASIGKLNILVDTPLADGKTYYKLYIWIDGNEENNTSMQSSSMKGVLNVNVTTPPVNVVTLVEGLDEGATGDSGSGVYKVQHDAIASSDSATGSKIPAVTDYRYYGPSPNNYICLDMEGSSTCPDRGLFRIIGSIYEENAGKNLLKVIKATPLTDGTTSDFSWDYKSDGTYSNIWSSTTSGTSSGATLMQLLNGIYLTRGTDSYYNGDSTAITVNFSSTGLTDVAQSLMNNGKSNNNLSRYYLGGYSDTLLKTDAIYLAERGTTTSSGNALHWDGKVGLMYPSDYGYAAGNDCVTNRAPFHYDDGCKNKDWLYRSNSYEWTMTSYSSEADILWYVDSTGYADRRSSDDPRGSHPTFYLKSDISVTDGTGTSSDPYIVK